MGLEQIFATGLALIVGVTLGVLGSGGSILTLPILVYIAGVETKTAIAMSLLVVGGTSLAGAYMHSRRGNFHLRAALLLGGTGIVGAYLGSQFTHLVASSVLMLIFSGLLLAVGLLMLKGREESLEPGRCRIVRCGAVGFIVGVLTGFLGVGGGFLIVPALVLFAGLRTKQAVGTSLSVIAINSASGLVGQLRFVRPDWVLTGALLLATLAGMLAGLSLIGRIQTRTLQRLFAGMLIVVGVVIAGLQV